MIELEERVPPKSPGSEESILASLIVNPDQLYRVADVLRPEHFYSPARATIYQAILDLSKEKIEIDIVTLSEKLISQGKLNGVGGRQYLTDLAMSWCTHAGLEWIADKVIETYKARLLIKMCNDTLSEVYSCNTEDLPDLLGKAQQTISKIGVSGGGDAPRPLASIVPTVFENIEERAQAGGALAGISTGFPDLDEITNGLSKGELIIIAGRPAMGKTSLAMQIGENVCGYGKTVLIFSLEMSKERLVLRMMSAASGINGADLSRGRVDGQGWDSLAKAAGKLAHSRLYICDPSFATTQDVSSKANRLVAEVGEIGLIVIDYIQLMQGVSRKGDPNRNNEVGEITRGLKCLAMALGVPVLALSQLSRAVEMRQDKRPTLADLRDSGSIEQDSDMVLFVYRDDYYNPKSDKKGEAEIIVAKNRSGPIGTADLLFDAARTQFKSKWSR